MAESPVRVCHPRELAGVLTTPRPFFVQSSGVQPHTGTGEFCARPSAEGEDMKTAIFYQGTADVMGGALSLAGGLGYQFAQDRCRAHRDDRASRALEACRRSRSRLAGKTFLGSAALGHVHNHIDLPATALTADKSRVLSRERSSRCCSSRPSDQSVWRDQAVLFSRLGYLYIAQGFAG
jgi:hypothetical protein